VEHSQQTQKVASTTNPEETMCVAEPIGAGPTNSSVAAEAHAARSGSSEGAGLDELGLQCVQPETGADGHGAAAGHGGHAAAKKHAVLDLSGLINASTVGSVLDSLADEPGEAGVLSFEVSAFGKVGSGVLSGKLEGLAELKFQYLVNDQNFHVLAVDWEGAIRAGFDLAGFVGAGVEVGLGGDFMNKWYKSPEGAGQWIVDQLARINKLAKGKLFHIEGSGGHAEHPSFDVHDKEVKAGVYAEADAGVVSADAEYSVSKLSRTYHDDEHHEIPSTEEHRKLDLGLSGEAGPITFTAHYTRDWSNTVGSPMYYSNGIFNEHDFSISVGLEKLLKKGPEKEVVPPEKIQDLVVNAFAALEKAVGKVPAANNLTYKLFTHIVEKIYEGTGSKLGVGGEVTLHFNWNEYGESTGDLNVMYFRTLVELALKAGGEANAVAAGVSAELSASKSEVVYESIGTETISYVQRQFIYSNDARPWSAFKAKNESQLRKLVKNCATKGFLYYYPAVEAAYGEEGDYEAGIAALEAVWREQNEQVQDITPDCAEIGKHLDEATSMFTWFDSTIDKHLGAIFEVFEKYKNDPQLLRYLFEQLPNYAVELSELEKVARKHGFGEKYDELRKIAGL